MLKRVLAYMAHSDAPVCEATRELHDLGYAIAKNVFEPEALAALAAEIKEVFGELPPDIRRPELPAESYDSFRYEMINRSALSQKAIASPGILRVIEPHLGNDCHVIANTAWRNPAGPVTKGAQAWHIDAGPHVPRPPGTRWPEEIPYPVFAVAAHILLQDQTLDDGPTGVVPGSHRSGRFPPFDRLLDPDLDYEGEHCIPILARAGDVAFFVSDLWHRRMPSSSASSGRFFLQVHYGRRDIAQRLRTTRDANSLSREAIERAETPREQTVVGLHPPYFYDG
jgi:ectoine hydroxylase-related dioxygenase (phytanoyl-CoA dioxygenase family)